MAPRFGWRIVFFSGIPHPHLLGEPLPESLFFNLPRTPLTNPAVLANTPAGAISFKKKPLAARSQADLGQRLPTEGRGRMVHDALHEGYVATPSWDPAPAPRHPVALRVGSVRRRSAPARGPNGQPL